MLPLPPWTRTAIVAVLALLLFSAGWLVRGWRADAAIAELRTAQATALQKLAEANNDAAQKATDRQTKLQAAAAQVDSLQGELTHAQADIDRLRAAVAAGSQRVLIRAACPAASAQVPAPPAAPSVDHATTVELTPAVGTNILGIKSGIVADQSALTALQTYVRTVCLAPQ